jgi:hypothetical protein
MDLSEDDVSSCAATSFSIFTLNQDLSSGAGGGPLLMNVSGKLIINADSGRPAAG